jgi:ParB family chromosome partitioning protein
MLVELVRITDIKIGERYRQDLGDVQALADSIKEVGLLHPPVIDSGNVLIAGERRIRACELLGWTEIPVRRLDLADIVRGEYAENAIRKDFAPSEAVAIAKALEPYEKEAAAERMRGVRKISLGSEKGQTRDRIAAVVGMSGRTLEKARDVVQSGRRELVEEMDRTGKVDPVHRKLRKKATQLARAKGILVELTRADVDEILTSLLVKPTPRRLAIIEKLRKAKRKGG